MIVDLRQHRFVQFLQLHLENLIIILVFFNLLELFLTKLRIGDCQELMEGTIMLFPLCLVHLLDCEANTLREGNS